MDDKRMIRRPEFREFFDALFRPEELVEFRFIESWTSNGKRRSRVAGSPRWLPTGELLDEYDTLVAFAEVERANIYFGVCPRSKEGDAIDKAIVIVRCLWADIDDTTVEEARRRWHAARIPIPSIIVRSGSGVHAYWLLDQDLTTTVERQRLVAILPGFYASFGGDHVQNLSRVMRPPGTLNCKEARNGRRPVACSLVSCKPDLRYPFAAFAKWMTRTDSSNGHRNQASNCDAGTGTLADNVFVFHDEALALASRLELPSEDRSRRDFAIVCEMLKLGLSTEEIWAIVGDKSKFESNGRPYFDLTITNALAKATSSSVTASEPSAPT